MPIYEYQCTECGELVEALQKVSDAPLTVCPACGEATLRKKVSAAAFRLKGGGWYETDFKSGNKKNLAGESSPDAKPAEGGAAKAKSESGGDGGGAGKSDSSAGKKDSGAGKAASDS
jgi:putative FmdB family regulatory protein